jgi:hypothetical protein
MRTGRRGSLVVLGLALAGGGPLGAQRAELPHGLQAGRRDVGIRALPSPSERITVWYPASCGRRPPASPTPCRDAVPDSGRFPLLLFAPAGGQDAQDTVLARYFASHGYVVVVASGDSPAPAGLEAALQAARALPFVDSTQVAVAGAGAGADAARQLAVRGRAIGALAELRPAEDPPLAAAGGRIATLIVRDSTDRPAAALGRRLTVSLPGGPSDHVRLVIAVTHAFLNAALGRGSLSLTDLTRRLRAAGLAACCPADHN